MENNASSVSIVVKTLATWTYVEWGLFLIFLLLFFHFFTVRHFTKQIAQKDELYRRLAEGKDNTAISSAVSQITQYLKTDKEDIDK